MKMGDDEFAVETLAAASSNQTTQYPATIKGLQDIEIRPQVSGFIVKLCVDEGATVRKGQALFQIDPTQYKAAYDQAKASVASAKANLETVTSTEANKKMLHEQKIISDFEYQTAVNNLLSAKASLAQAEASCGCKTEFGLLYRNQSFRWSYWYFPVSCRCIGWSFCS